MKALIKKMKRVMKRILKMRETKTDPLSVLREDTYSNDEIDLMSGRMHRREYTESQSI